MPIETTLQEEYIEDHPEYARYAEKYHWSAPFGKTTHNRPIFWLPVSHCFPNAWNPNVEKPKTFDGLVANITEVGFSQNIQVIAWDQVRDQVMTEFDWFTEDYRRDAYRWVEEWLFMIIGGEHRLNAAVFKDMDTLPCVIMVDMDEMEYAQFQTMRFNILTGEIGPEKFTELVNWFLRKPQYSKALIADMMGFPDQKVFDRLYLQARQSLPRPLRKKLDKVKKDLETVDQLADVIHALMASYGDDLSRHNFMMFPMQGKIHMMVDMDKPLLNLVNWLTDYVRDTNGNMTVLFNELLAQYQKDIVDA